MPNVCSAFGCTNRSNKTTEDISYFSFPLGNNELLQKWLINMKRDRWYPNQYSRLCSLHFEDKFVYKVNDRRRLQIGAVPTKFCFPPHLRKKEANRRLPTVRDQGNSTQEEQSLSKKRDTCVSSPNKTMPMCCAYRCSYQHWKTKTTGKSVHRFPFSRPDMVKKWVKKMKRKDFHPTRWSILCSDHFEESCFDRTGQAVRLHPNAVPTIFNFPRDIQKKNTSGKSPATRHCKQSRNRKACATSSDAPLTSSNNETQPSDTQHDEQSSTIPLLCKIKEEPPEVTNTQSPAIEYAVPALQLRIENTMHVDSWETEPDDDSRQCENSNPEPDDGSRQCENSNPEPDDGSSQCENSNPEPDDGSSQCENSNPEPDDDDDSMCENSNSEPLNVPKKKIIKEVISDTETSEDESSVDNPSSNQNIATIVSSIDHCHNYAMKPHSMNHYNHIINYFVKTNEEVPSDQICVNGLNSGEGSRDYPRTVGELVRELVKLRKQRLDDKKKIKLLQQSIRRYQKRIISLEKFLKSDKVLDISEDEDDDTMDLLEGELEENELFTIFHMP